MNARNSASIVIADDNPLILAGMAALIQSDAQLNLSGQACRGNEAVELYERVLPDLMLIDLNMAGFDGVNAVSEICSRRPSAKIIILSSYDSEEDIDRGMRAGAYAYMLKSASLEDLMKCIFIVLSGKKYIMPELAVKMATRIPSNELTPRERNILSHVATGSSNKVIARKAGICEGTVKFHVKSIMLKLNVSTRTEAAMLAARRGLVQMC
jgi:two-component system NarL family response regulator